MAGMAGEHLLVIGVVNAHGRIILQTVWLTDPKSGHRRTDSETVEDAAALLRRLGELAPLLYQNQALPARAAA